MRKFLNGLVVIMVLALFSPWVLAAPLEETHAMVGSAILYGFVIMVGGVIALVCFMKVPDQGKTTLHGMITNKILDDSACVESNVLVIECVRKMAAKKISALMVMDGEKLVGIFTESDALNRVLASGRDPRSTKVVEVMTIDPCCAAPDMTVEDAMDLVAKKQFRHLPVIENGKVKTMLSRGDLKYFAKNKKMPLETVDQLEGV